MKQLCKICNKRPAKFKRHRKIKARHDHDICMQCFRSISESNVQREKALV